MADEFHSHNNAALLSLLANGAQTNADFDFGKINKSYWEGLDQSFKNDFRDKLAAGLPKGPDGLPDYGQTAKILIEGGQFEPGLKAGELGIRTANPERRGSGCLSSCDGARTPTAAGIAALHWRESWSVTGTDSFLAQPIRNESCRISAQ